MASDSQDPKAAPDRVFARASALVLGTGMVVVLAGQAAVWRVAAEQDAAGALAMAATSEAAAARAVVVALDRLAGLPEGGADRAAGIRLAWAVDRLVALDDARLALTPYLPAREGPIGAVAAAVKAGPAPAGAAATALQDHLEARILPQLDLIAERARAEAEAAGDRSRWTVGGALLGQLLAGWLLLGAVVRPAQRRIGDWVARTEAEGRETRFRLLHDALTGMPNATYANAHLTRLVAAKDRARRQTAVLRIGLDRFKLLRETLGQPTADEVLGIVARRLQKALRAGDFAAHFGRHDFLVVAGDLEDGNEAAAIAGRVQAALGKPVSVRGGARRITCSVGVTLLSDDRPDTERVLANAEIALGAAQAAGPGSVRYFREDLRLEAERREALFAELTHGLEVGEIMPFFQPQVDLATGELAGFEALARWEHPVRGLLEPDAFLDLAERTDLTERIGELMLTRSLEAIRTWDQAGLRVPRVGVNFALGQLCDPRLIEKIKWETERFGVEPDRIAIEVLETVLIKNDADMVVRNLRGLASAGYHVELDDFGTGHASIANLRRFMVNRIKIDRSFIAGIEASEEQQTLTASMIAMAQALGIGTLAEGVETEAARATLARLGCGQVQGYLLARPMSLVRTLPWLEAFRPLPHGAGAAAQGLGPDPNTP